MVGLPSRAGLTPAELHDLAWPHNRSVPVFAVFADNENIALLHRQFLNNQLTLSNNDGAM
jgi:hypothetical protein